MDFFHRNTHNLKLILRDLVVEALQHLKHHNFYFHFSHFATGPFVFPLCPFSPSHLSSLPFSLALRFLVISFLPLLLLSPPSLHSPTQLSEVVSWFLLPTSSWSWLIMESS